MSFVLPDLPYPKTAFKDTISSETFDFHYSKHHQAYVTNLNNLIKGTEWEKQSLTDIIIKYKIYDSGVQMSKFLTMLLSIGTILSIGIAFLLKKPNLLLNSRPSLKRNGAVLISFWQSLLLRPLPTLVQDGPGL